MPEDAHHAPETPRPADEGPASIKPILILPVVIITCVAGVALALVNEVTKDSIAESKKQAKAEALAAVLPPFENDPTSDVREVALDPEAYPEAGDNPLTFYAGRDGAGKLTGWGIESAVESGYSGHYSLVFGIDPEGRVQKVQVLEQRETPGLGTKSTDEAWLSQFEGKALADFQFTVAKDGGDVDAITGATISSRAVSRCIEQGLQQYEAEFKGQDPGPATPPAEEGGE